MNEPALEAMLKNFSEGGWETLASATDISAAKKRERQSRAMEVSNDVLWILSHPQGRRAFDWFLNETVRKASWHGDLRTPLDQVSSYGLLREGQNSAAAMWLQAARFQLGDDISTLYQPIGEAHETLSFILRDCAARARRWFRRQFRRG